jgi:hypothetical protein
MPTPAGDAVQHAERGQRPDPFRRDEQPGAGAVEVRPLLDHAHVPAEVADRRGGCQARDARADHQYLPSVILAAHTARPVTARIRRWDAARLRRGRMAVIHTLAGRPR